MNPSHARQHKAGRPLGLGTALLGFILLCGLVLLLAGGPEPGCSGCSRASKKDDLIQRLASTQKKLGQVKRALDAANYGAARNHLGQVQESLGIVLHELRGPAERPSARKE